MSIAGEEEVVAVPGVGRPPEDEEEEDLDAPEYHGGDMLDLGEMLVQQLSLAMAAFPRKEGAESLAEAYAPPENTSPFAALKGAFKSET